MLNNVKQKRKSGMGTQASKGPAPLAAGISTAARNHNANMRETARAIAPF